MKRIQSCILFYENQYLHAARRNILLKNKERNYNNKENKPKIYFFVFLKVPNYNNNDIT